MAVPFTPIIYAFLLGCCLMGTTALAQQREYGRCDSTLQFLNADSSVVVGRHRLYWQSIRGQTLLAYFPPSDTNQFIRDMDIVQDRLWYVVLGSKFIGSDTELYRSTDQGQTWVLDTSYYVVLPQGNGRNNRGINNLQPLSGDTIALFVGYYQSAVLYSTDAGRTWNHWLDNYITHYHGLLRCRDSVYLYGMEGDGFRASMFGFHQNLLFTRDSATQWTNFNFNGAHPDCYNGNNSCIYAPPNIGRCNSYQYFEQYIDSLCRAPILGLDPKTPSAPIQLYPNPAQHSARLVGLDLSKDKVQVYNALLQPCAVATQPIADGLELQLHGLPAGWYYVVVESDRQKRQVLTLGVLP